MSELRFKYGEDRTELQGSELGFNVCVAPSSVKLGVLEFAEMVGVVRRMNGDRIMVVVVIE